MKLKNYNKLRREYEEEEFKIENIIKELDPKL